MNKVDEQHYRNLILRLQSERDEALIQSNRWEHLVYVYREEVRKATKGHNTLNKKVWYWRRKYETLDEHMTKLEIPRPTTPIKRAMQEQS